MIIGLLGNAINVVGAVAPRLSEDATYALFRNLRPRGKVREGERAIHELARTTSITVNGKRVLVYAWGDGRRPVLLVHGWQSRASRFAGLVQPLIDRGFSPVSFDAPANGDSTGVTTTLLEYEDAIRQLSTMHGPWEGLVCHSFGALAGLYTMRNEPGAPQIVTIAGVSDFQHMFEAFRGGLGLNARMTERLRDRVETDLFPGIDDLWSAFDSARNPEEIPGRLLMLHSADDRTVPVAATERLSDAFGGRVTTSVVDGLGHHRILSDPRIIWEVVDFLSRAPVEPRRGR